MSETKVEGVSTAETNSTLTVVGVSNTLLSDKLTQVINEMKVISGKGIETGEMYRFLNTVTFLGNVKRDQTRVEVNGDSYMLSEYELDPRFKRFALPREVVAADEEYFYQKDLRVHSDADMTKLLTAGEFKLFQVKVANQFKASLQQTETMDTVIARVVLSSVKTIYSPDGKRVHVENLSTASNMPIMLKCIDDMYEADYFDISVKKWMEKFAANFGENFRKVG